MNSSVGLCMQLCLCLCIHLWNSKLSDPNLHFHAFVIWLNFLYFSVMFLSHLQNPSLSLLKYMNIRKLGYMKFLSSLTSYVILYSFIKFILTRVPGFSFRSQEAQGVKMFGLTHSSGCSGIYIVWCDVENILKGF